MKITGPEADPLWAGTRILCLGIAGVCAAALPENAPHLAARCRARGLASQGAVR